MIVPDLNLIVFAYSPASPFHSGAIKWWERLLNGSEMVGIPWLVSTGFIRLTTHPKVFSTPLSVDSATEIVSTWYVQPNVRALEPGSRHLTLLSSLLHQVQVGGKLVSDAHLAAIAIEHRAVLHSHDRDFERFSGLQLHDPL